MFGVLVADRLEEVAEIFGSPRLRVHDGVTVLLTSVDAFVSDMRLLGPYLRALVDAKRNGNESLVSALGANLAELGKLVAEIERHTDNVASALEKQAGVLRDTIVERLCGRVRDVVVGSQQRLDADDEDN
jgi:CII-binding regulator of phage lambda lysogenization HflD